MSDAEGSRIGTRFGPYRLRRLLGRGGFGDVYEAEDTVMDRVVALKLLNEAYSKDPVFRARLQREAKAAGRLHEPHVVPIHGYGEIDGLLYVDMRLIEGTDLYAVLKRFGPMSPARAVAIARQVASALDAAHAAGMIHRDVKPENILLTDEDFAYLVDFGIANAISDERLTQLGTAVGTYAYMAPERFGDTEATYRVDIYALACVLFECLTGSRPYRANSMSGLVRAHLMDPIPRPSELHVGIPAGFDAVIARGMAKNPDDRYASARDLVAAAHNALTLTDQHQADNIVNRSQLATRPDIPAPPTPSPRYSPPPAYARNAPTVVPPARTTPPPVAPSGSAQSWPSQPPTAWGPPQPVAPQQFWSQPAPMPPARKRKTWLLIGAAATVVVALVVGLAIWLWPSPPPANAVTLLVLDNGVSVGAADVPTTLDIFNEPMCPPCGNFIRSYAEDLQTAIDDKKITVRYHLLNFLDDRSASGDYSTRALAASLCVASAEDPKLYTEFYAGLFGRSFQPPEDGRIDPSDSELAQLAESLGASGNVTDCITSGQDLDTAKTTAKNASDKLAGLMSEPTTPKVFNGRTMVDISDSSWLQRLL